MTAEGVILEQIQSQVHLVLEAVTTGFARLDAKIDATRQELSDRITVLEAVVRQHSQEIRELKIEVSGLRRDVDALRRDVDALRRDVDALRRDFNALRHDFDHRAELARIEALETRVAGVERQLGI